MKETNIIATIAALAAIQAGLILAGILPLANVFLGAIVAVIGAWLGQKFKN